MNELYIALPHIIALTSLFVAMICLIIAAAGKRQIGASWEFVAWKNNNIIFTTPMSAIDIQIHGLTVSQSNVIATGNVVYRHPNSSVYAHATVWTNGEPETLAQGADDINVYFANSIVVKH